MNKDTRLSDVLHVLLHMDQIKEPLASELLARSMATKRPIFRRTMAGLREAELVRTVKGRSGGWTLARPLEEITLLAVYQALGCPNLLSIGNRNQHTDCPMEKGVNLLVADAMAGSASQFEKRLGEITLDQIAPAAGVSSRMLDGM